MNLVLAGIPLTSIPSDRIAAKTCLIYVFISTTLNVNGLVQDCSNSSALAMELLQSCTKSLMCSQNMGIYISKYWGNNKYVTGHPWLIHVIVMWKVMASMITCGIELFIHSQTSIVQLLKFRNGYVIPYHTLLGKWGGVTHTCASKLTIIGSDNGLSPGRRQAIIWSNAGILSIGPLGTNFSEIFINIHIFSFKKIHLKMSSENGIASVLTSMSWGPNNKSWIVEAWYKTQTWSNSTRTTSMHITHWYCHQTTTH